MARVLTELQDRVGKYSYSKLCLCLFLRTDIGTEKAEAQLASSLGLASSNQPAPAPAPAAADMHTSNNHIDPLYLHHLEPIQYHPEMDDLSFDWPNDIQQPQVSAPGDQQMTLERQASQIFDM